MLQFRGSAITSDGGLLAYRERDDARGFTEKGADTLADSRTGKNFRHLLAGLLRQPVFGGLAGYEDVSDTNWLCHDPRLDAAEAAPVSTSAPSRWFARTHAGTRRSIFVA
jgi:hypothetical protein